MRKGSALLIVLGMISFMLFSGIAFSVYMRQTRMPSTFLRRTTVTRQLAKAALAEAIGEIDYRIGSDPHPGVRASAGTSSSGTGIGSGSTGSTVAGNFWNHRVFVRNENYANNDNGYTGDDTISTLTLEGLAYLPPALINEVRYYSRHTPTAKWQPFRFDAGRYAYCAIDVSDYFDVNRLLADRPRSSASSRRITFAHAFEDAGAGGLHGAQKAGEAEAWDEWLESKAAIRTVDPDTDKMTFTGVPIVSLADFNLLMSTESFGKIKSPFITYLDSSANAFYSDAGSSEEDAQAEAYRSMTFVTDSLFRKPTADEKDLEDPENQPFDSADLKRSVRTSLVELQNNLNGRQAVGGYLELLSRIGMVTLYDYLDENSLPVSLTLPTVERNPMICGITPHFDGVTFKVTKKTDDLKGGDGGKLTYPTTKKRTVSQKVQYLIDGGSLGMSMAGKSLEGVAVYPFLHTEGEAKVSYNLDGKMALYLTKDGDKVRMAGSGVNANFTFGKNGTADPDQSVTLNEQTGLLSIPLTGSMSVPAKVTKEEEASFKFVMKTTRATDIKNVLLDSGAAGKHWVSLTYQWEQEFTGPDIEQIQNESFWEPKPGEKGTYSWDNVVGGGKGAAAGLEAMSCRWLPIDGNGMPIKDLKTIYGYLTGTTKFHLNMALWLRIRRSGADSGTVDMVPACAWDDKEQGLSTANPNALSFDQNLHRYYQQVEGLGRYVMRFGLDQEGISLGSVAESASMSLESIPKQVMIKDPRYNHNPNNWIAVDDGAGDLLQYWRDHNGASGRDGDIFMSVSNQGYLQSIYELGFLPRLTNPGSTKNDPVGQNFGMFRGNRTDFDAAADQDGLMWRTYRVFGADADPLYEPGFVSGLHGLKVNPYSDSIEVLAAAFANTPADWAHASTNATMNVHSSMGADDFNKSCAWNAYSTGTTKLMWADLQNLAYAYHDLVRTPPYSTGQWESAFENLGWSTDRRKILNGSDEIDSAGSDMYSVDKKFLFGFWRDCFAANQQLFLIFVRAEPMMMGGGVAGNAPPQLSSRAVALVWRDPEGRKSGASAPGTTSTTREPPHGLRVLFYHPLD